MSRPHADDWIVERWRTEPRLSKLQTLEVEESSLSDAPALWKDVAVATFIAVMLWASAAALFW
jgi:hypothetical protein